MIPKETLCEILRYLVEHEELKSIDALGSISRDDVRVALLKLSDRLELEAKKEHENELNNYQNFEELSGRVKELLSNLTPSECNKLFKQFGVES